jgi:outer membrane protein OmpA-like peptidoglycan-associated protein
VKALYFAAITGATLALGGCEKDATSPVKVAVGQAATRSSACTSLDNFFLANIGRQWSGGISVPVIGGLSGSKAQIVEYERLADDESKKQMALAAVACELFQTGQLGTGDAAVEKYQKLLDQGINAGMRAEALRGNDANRFLNEFKAALAASAVQAVGNKDQFEKLAARMEQTVAEERERLPKIEEDARAARESADAARDYAMQILKADAGALQQLTTLEATVGTLRNDIEYRFNQIDKTLIRFKTKWGITDADTPRCDRGEARIPYFFAVNKRVLDKRIANSVSGWATTFVKANPGCRLYAKVEAFTDPSGDASYNEALSRDRAHRTAELLRAAGITIIEERGGGSDSDAENASVARVVYVTLGAEPSTEAQPVAAPTAATASSTPR